MHVSWVSLDHFDSVMGYVGYERCTLFCVRIPPVIELENTPETSELLYRFDYRFVVYFNGTCGGMAREVYGVLRTIRAREEKRAVAR